MKRRLVKQGASTMMISLPSKWIKANKLDKGSEVDLEDEGNKILISLDSKKKSETTISISNLTESSIRTLITNAYRTGFDKIKIEFQDKNSLKHTQDIVNNNLIGFEVIRKTDKSCELENITEPSPEQFDNIFLKIISNIDELFIIAEKMLRGEKQDFEETETKIQQFDNFCRRIIAKNNPINYQLKWAFHSELIHAQREIYHLLRYLSKFKVKAEKPVLLLLEDCKKLFEMLTQAYKEKNIPILEKIHEKEKEITYKRGYDLIKTSKDKIIIHYILSSSRGFYLASSPLIGIVLSKEILSN